MNLDPLVGPDLDSGRWIQIVCKDYRQTVKIDESVCCNILVKDCHLSRLITLHIKVFSTQ